MVKGSFSRALLAAAFVAALPGAALAQDSEATPEGTTWHLTSFASDGGTESVPWTVDATLLLEDGAATGSSGCNTFSGSYMLDGDTLTFGEAFAVTRMACVDPYALIESAYLALLPETATWAVEGDVLTLSDSLGEPLLDYEQATVALTLSDLAAIASQFDEQQAQIDRAGERIDNIRIRTLRDRIKELESSVANLKAAAAAAASSSSSASAYNAKEKVLLKAIPPKVERICKPLRTSLPQGTVAAVACAGSAGNVAEQAYYLMEWGDAVTTMRSVATANGAPKRQVGCARNTPSWVNAGASIGAEACWVDGGKANYRLVTRAAGCQQLDVAGTHLSEPALYLAMESKNGRIGPLRSAGLLPTDSNYFIGNFDAIEYIPAGNQPKTPGCKAHQDWVG